MPILKVSENLYKEAMEVIRINITVLGDCPQCQGHNYRSGVCEDCAFISPEVMQAIQEWQISQGIQQKAAAQRFSFVDAMPAMDMNTKCPGGCGKYGFNLECDHCGYRDLEALEQLGLERRKTEMLGIRPGIERRRRFVPTAEVYENSKKHKKHKKHKTKAKKRIEAAQIALASKNPEPGSGALLDDSVIVSPHSRNPDASARLRGFLQDAALTDAQDPDQEEQK